MDNCQLKKYLYRALELEKNKLELEQMLSKLDCKYEAKLTGLDERVINSGTNTPYEALMLVGAVGGFLFAAMFSLNGLGMIFIGGILGLVIAMKLDRKERDKKREEQAQKNSEIEDNNQKIIVETDRKNEILIASLDNLKLTLSNTQTELELLYAENIIYPKYRNLVAVASIYEYLDSGRCEQLEGADGAYNIYEMEVRLDRIITKLDIIISNLEQIKNNQYYLYSAINELKPRIDTVTESIIENTKKLDEIAVNTAVSAYTAQVIERNQYYGRNWNDGRTYDDRLNMNRIK